MELPTFEQLKLDLSSLTRVDEYLGPELMLFYYGQPQWCSVVSIARNADTKRIQRPLVGPGYQNVGIYVDPSNVPYVLGIKGSRAFVKVDGDQELACGVIECGKPGWTQIVQFLGRGK